MNVACHLVYLRIPSRRARKHQVVHARRAGIFNGIHHNDALQRSLLAHRKNLIELGLGGNKRYARSGIAKNMSHLLRGQRGVNWHDHSSEQEGGEIRRCPFRTVFAENRHAIPFCDFPLTQSPCDPDGVAVELLR